MVEVAVRPAICIVECVNVTRVESKVHIMLVICIEPVVHQSIQQIKVVRHRSQAAVVNVFVRSFAAAWTDSPYDLYILGFDHFFEQASVKQILVIGEILACWMIQSKEK